MIYIQAVRYDHLIFAYFPLNMCSDLRQMIEQLNYVNPSISMGYKMNEKREVYM